MKIKSVFSILLITCVFSCDNISEKRSGIRIPGEFEPQGAIWMGLATNEGHDSTTIEMIRALSGSLKLNLIVEHDSLFREGNMFFSKSGIDTSNISIVYQSPTDIWFRDPGPVFGITPDKKLAIADFKYTDYANVPPDSLSEKAKAHEGIDRDIAARLNISAVESKVAMEGGAFETNGRGALIQVESITLNRNPHLTKPEIEQDFKDNFNMTEIIWLPSGVVDDPQNFSRIYKNIFGYGTGGHTDEFIRFANDSTILMAWVDESERSGHPIDSLNYEVLSKNYEILKNYIREDGSHFKVIKVPHPAPKTYEYVIPEKGFPGAGARKKFGLNTGDAITMAYSSSYMNYVITDNLILLPQYWTASLPARVKEEDNQVMALFKQLYPDRKIVGINPLLLNSRGGGMHCRYQSQPKVD